MNFTDGTWAGIEAELKTMLESERKRLEDPLRTHDETQVSRGRIGVLKELLALPARREALTWKGDPA